MKAPTMSLIIGAPKRSAKDVSGGSGGRPPNPPSNPPKPPSDPNDSNNLKTQYPKTGKLYKYADKAASIPLPIFLAKNPPIKAAAAHAPSK